MPALDAEVPQLRQRSTVQVPPVAHLRILEVTQIKSVPYAPPSHPFVERLIGTLVMDNKMHRTKPLQDACPMGFV
jgi:hypothetical protein